MPIKIPNALPAHSILESENIFVMSSDRAEKQDIRPLKIVILNLMPTKIVTETQLLRCLSNTPLQIEVDLMQTSTYKSKNTPEDHLLNFYNTFDELKHNRYDGMIITGAPVENMEFEEVQYWDELCEIMEWSKSNVFSTFHICWGAQAALYYHYGIPKHMMDKKLFGVFRHRLLDKREPIFRGFNEYFNAPHSRHTTVYSQDIEKVDALKILAISDDAGVYMIEAHNGRQFFITGHSEYDADTLAKEYFRDVEKGLTIEMPKNYFPDDDPSKEPPVTWRSHSTLLYTNWLNYYVYQSSPYNLLELGGMNGKKEDKNVGHTKQSR